MGGLWPRAECLSVMVVVPEPSVKGGGAFGAVAVDRAVGPAAEEGADEPFGFAVGLGSVGAGAQVADPEGAAGDRVDRGAVGAAVVGQERSTVMPWRA